MPPTLWPQQANRLYCCNLAWTGQNKAHGIHQVEHPRKQSCGYLIQVPLRQLGCKLFAFSHLDYCWCLGKPFLFICHAFTVYSQHRNTFIFPPTSCDSQTTLYSGNYTCFPFHQRTQFKLLVPVVKILTSYITHSHSFNSHLCFCSHFAFFNWFIC